MADDKKVSTPNQGITPKGESGKSVSTNGTVDRDGAKAGWGPPTEIADYNKG